MISNATDKHGGRGTENECKESTKVWCIVKISGIDYGGKGSPDVQGRMGKPLASVCWTAFRMVM